MRRGYTDYDGDPTDSYGNRFPVYQGRRVDRDRMNSQRLPSPVGGKYFSSHSGNYVGNLE